MPRAHCWSGSVYAVIYCKPQWCNACQHLTDACAGATEHCTVRHSTICPQVVMWLFSDSRVPYWEAASSIYHHLPQVQQPTGLLDPLKLGSICGSFSPLTPPAPKKAWYKLPTEPVKTMPMTGCHILLRGQGVQWTQAQVHIYLSCLPIPLM